MPRLASQGDRADSRLREARPRARGGRRAPAAPFATGTATYFLSARMGCQVLHPIYGLDLAAPVRPARLALVEVQRQRVDAVALAARAGAVREDVARGGRRSGRR